MADIKDLVGKEITVEGRNFTIENATESGEFINLEVSEETEG